MGVRIGVALYNGAGTVTNTGTISGTGTSGAAVILNNGGTVTNGQAGTNYGLIAGHRSSPGLAVSD